MLLADRLISEDCKSCGRSLQTLRVAREIDGKLPYLKFQRIVKLDDARRLLQFADGVEMVVEYSGTSCVLRFRSGIVTKADWEKLGICALPLGREFGFTSFMSRMFSYLRGRR